MKLTLALLTALLLAPLASGSALNVVRFGAVPDDGRDDTDAFLAVFKEAKAKGEKRIVIPKGRYELRADGNQSQPDVLFTVADCDGLVIEGREAELVMTGKAAVFAFANCRNVTVSGVTIDWARPPFTEGTVIASAGRHFDLKVSADYPVKGGEPVGAFMSYHADTRLPDGGDLDIYDAVERTELVAPQMLQVHLKREIPVPVGKLLLLRHEVYGHNAFNFHRCSGITLSDVTVHCAPGMGLWCSVCNDLTLQRFNVRIRPGSGRLMSTTADAAHFGGCTGTVSIQDCFFEGMGDDGVNVKSGLYLTVCRRLDKCTVLAQHHLKMSDLPDVGNLIEMSHADSLSPFATGIVREASLELGGERTHRVRFADPLPPELRTGDMLANASRVAKLQMKGCTVRANRARGVLCQTRDAIIENCTFQNCTGPGVMVLTETSYFHESIGTRNVVVQNNRFENCNRGAASAEAALCALAYIKGGGLPSRPGVHRDVAFEGNRIMRTGESGIFAACVDGLKLMRNIVEQSGLAGSRPHGKEPIWIQDCARVIRK